MKKILVLFCLSLLIACNPVLAQTNPIQSLTKLNRALTDSGYMQTNTKTGGADNDTTWAVRNDSLYKAVQRWLMAHGGIGSQNLSQVLTIGADAVGQGMTNVTSVTGDPSKSFIITNSNQGMAISNQFTDPFPAVYGLNIYQGEALTLGDSVNSLLPFATNLVIGTGGGARNTISMNSGSNTFDVRPTSATCADTLFVNAPLLVLGNVGIGTTNPQATLDVNGTSHFSDKVGMGAINTTDQLLSVDALINCSNSLLIDFFGVNAGTGFTGDHLCGYGHTAANDATGQWIMGYGYGACTSCSGTIIMAYGSEAAEFAEGDTINAYGSSAAQSTTASVLDAYGASAGFNSSGRFVDCYGLGAGVNNTHSNVALFGKFAHSDQDSTLILGDASWMKYVGIGTTTPGSLLEVDGKVTIADGTQGANKISVIADANGVISLSESPYQLLSTTDRLALTPTEGQPCYDITLHKLYIWDGSSWNAAW